MQSDTNLVGSDGYRPDIDGLRAIAVLGVMAYHLDLPLFSGGFVGVDVFFVISGYLITCLILREARAESFRFGNFWLRRFRRLMPAMLVMLVATAVAAYLMLYPLEFRSHFRSLLMQALSMGNFFFYRQDPYFSPHTELMPLLHTWSLAVEEQFYLIYPLLLLPLFQASPRRRLIWLSLGCGAGIMIAEVLVRSDMRAAFYLLPGRLWELLAGGWLAVLPAVRPSGRTAILRREAQALVGFLVILMAMIAFHAHMSFPGLAALLPVVGTMLVLRAGQTPTPTFVGRVLAMRPMVFVGLISYSLYLWHWPLIVFARYLDADLSLPWAAPPLSSTATAVVGFLCFPIAWMSWRYVERPFRQRQLLVKSRRFLTVMTVSVLALVSYALAMDMDLVRRYPPAEAALLQAEIEPANRCRHWSDELWYTPFCEVEAGVPARGSVLLFGDSHAGMVWPAVAEVAREMGVGVYVNRQRCPVPALKEDRWCNLTLAELGAVIRRHDVRLVILASRWDRWVIGAEPGGVDETLGLPVLTKAEQSHRAAELGAVLDHALTIFRDMGVEVAIMKQVPLMLAHPPRALAAIIRDGGNPRHAGKPLEVHRRVNAPVEQVIDRAAAGRARVLDPARWLCVPDDLCPMIDDKGQSLYQDDNHLSKSGGKVLAPMFDALMTAVFKSEAKVRPMR
ncbi:acyltransferase family protein [Tistrella mobilis]|uniref:acyltransferase family protein n=1 Tax=Tistrella mobilis TaxID=171437 RepID=UPI0031F64F61